MTLAAVIVNLALPVAIVLSAVATAGLTLWANRLQRQVDDLIVAGAHAEARTWPYPLDDEDDDQ